MIRVRTAKRKPRFFRGGHEFSQQVRTLTEPGDNLPEGVEPDLTKDQAKAIRGEKTFLEVDSVPADEAKEILASLAPAQPKNPKQPAKGKAGNKGNGGKSAGNSSAAGKGDDPASKGAGEYSENTQRSGGDDPSGKAPAGGEPDKTQAGPSDAEDDGAKSSAEGPGKVNVNTASAKELAAVSGIGEEIAKAIVNRRKTNPFKGLEQLEIIPGLAAKSIAKLADRLTV